LGLGQAEAIAVLRITVMIVHEGSMPRSGEELQGAGGVNEHDLLWTTQEDCATFVIVRNPECEDGEAKHKPRRLTCSR
jgi:hypothetical protein